MTPEEKARQQIDAMLSASGWTVQTKDQLNLSAARGVVLCELAVTAGEPDYTLFVDGKAIGTTEAKPEGHSLTGVEEQSTKYVSGVPASLPAWRKPLPFCYESTGSETPFTNRLDPEPRSRRVFAFHRPETLLAWVQQEKQLAQRLRELPPLNTTRLWPAQVETVINLEKSFAAGLPRALVQTACPRRIQPRLPHRGIRFHHHRRVPPLHLQPLAAGPRILRRLAHRPHRHTIQADLWFLQAEPGHGIQP